MSGGPTLGCESSSVQRAVHAAVAEYHDDIVGREGGVPVDRTLGKFLGLGHVERFFVLVGMRLLDQSVVLLGQVLGIIVCCIKNAMI
jgi:hypothetical protein